MSGFLGLPVVVQAAILLAASNVFMTLGWYKTRDTCREPKAL